MPGRTRTWTRAAMKTRAARTELRPRLVVGLGAGLLLIALEGCVGPGLEPPVSDDRAGGQMPPPSSGGAFDGGAIPEGGAGGKGGGGGQTGAAGMPSSG